MPVPGELDRELRRWLQAYQDDVRGPLEPDWFLVPAHGAPTPFWDPAVKRWTAGYADRNLNPCRRVSGTSSRVQDALTRAGYPVRDDYGRSAGEGVHTLRRSGARALFDRLAGEGYDGAIRTVQAMLHHESQQTTEGYLGLTMDVKRRNDLLRGRDMFPTPDGVTVLREVQ